MREHDVVTVVGGGWSFDPAWASRLPGFVIGVNDAAILAPAHAAVSMDRLWTEHRLPRLMDRVGAGLEKAHLRTSALQRIARPLPTWIEPFENDHTSADLTEEPGRLNGTNSGTCALNLAFQVCRRRVLLYGFDMNRSPDGRAYWFPDYPWAKPGGSTGAGKYRAWAAELEIAARQFVAAGIEVLNASPTSAIDAFTKVHPEEYLR